MFEEWSCKLLGRGAASVEDDESGLVCGLRGDDNRVSIDRLFRSREKHCVDAELPDCRGDWKESAQTTVPAARYDSLLFLIS